MNRQGLIVLQVLGALSILPYPFVLLANVMSIAAPGQTRVGAIPFLVLSAYPVIWIGLYWFSWRAMGRGEVGLAFGLSAIPMLACLSLVGLYAIGWASYIKSSKLSSVGPDKGSNPLLTAIWSMRGKHQYPPGPAGPVEDALRAIDAHPESINTAVAPYGTPLQVAVSNLSIDLDGLPIGDPVRQQELILVVKTLVGHGARFGANEPANLRQQWLLRRAMHEGPITTASENPLVWRILTRKRDGVTPFFIRKEEIPLVNVSTELHGTPLYAALLQDGPDAYTEVIRAGGRLSAEEEKDPATQAALAKVLATGGLRSEYEKAR